LRVEAADVTDFALFATPVGVCGIAWNGLGIAGIQLPEARKAATRARMHERFPSAQEAEPPPEVQHAIDAIVGMLDGDGNDLRVVELDMRPVAPFSRRVYETARMIPPGTTLSYGEVAARMGAPRSARAVGQALGRNPFPIVVPCHRVFAAGGKVGGFSATGGTTTKLRLLALERTGP
jgi:O-6-methylguanine DNA methyltransferase